MHSTEKNLAQIHLQIEQAASEYNRDARLLNLEVNLGEIFFDAVHGIAIVQI